MKKDNRAQAARAARFLVQCFDVVCQTTTWNFHISYLSLWNHSCQASESALRLFCTTWSTWNNRKRLNWAQSSILMWRFPWTCRRSFLNSLFLVLENVTTLATLQTLKFRTQFKKLFVCLEVIRLEQSYFPVHLSLRIGSESLLWAGICGTLICCLSAAVVWAPKGPYWNQEQWDLRDMFR